MSPYHYLPLGYTYATRLRSPRALVGFLTQEYVPLVLALTVGLGTDATTVLLLVVATLNMYEAGYLLNDRAGSAVEPGGDRLRDLQVRPGAFCAVRLTVALLAVAAIATVASLAVALANLFLSLGLLALLALHSTRWVTSTGLIRVGTFSALALFKYVPFVAPVVPWTQTWLLVATVFVCYGVPRIVVYALRKFAATVDSGSVVEWQRPLQAVFLVMFGFIPTLWVVERTAITLAAGLVWLGYAGVVLALWAAHSTRTRMEARKA